MKAILEFWPIMLFGLGIVWALVETFFKVRENTERITKCEVSINKNEDSMEILKEDIHQTLKETAIHHNRNIEKLTDAVTQLIVTTEVLASKMESLKEKTENEKGCKNNCYRPS